MIELCDVGSFFVGGRKLVIQGQERETVELSSDVRFDHDPNGSYWVESAYVQYFLPAKPRFSTPVLLVHGGGRTGAVWETTPDGRRGWLNELLQANVAVYVIDNVERGRAGFCPFEGEWQGRPIMRSQEEAWSLYRLGPDEEPAIRQPFPGHQFPVEAMDALSAQAVPRWPANSGLQRIALIEAIRRIGPVILLAHSQGGGLSFHAADEMRDLVRACIMLEPHGMPMRFAPNVPGTPAVIVLGDFIEKSDYWTSMLDKYKKSLEAWQQAGGKAEIYDLPAHDIHGNSHSMMMDLNSRDVLNRLIHWMDQRKSEGVFE